jgi:hypothetical protein
MRYRAIILSMNKGFCAFEYGAMLPRTTLVYWILNRRREDSCLIQRRQAISCRTQAASLSLSKSSAPTVSKRAAMSRSTKRRLLILQAWDRWSGSHHIAQAGATRRETLQFYLELRDANSPLLNFNSRGRDKWEIVHSWLITAGRVQDNDQP